MLLEDVEQLLKMWASCVVRNELLAELAEGDRDLAKEKADIADAQRAISKSKAKARSLRQMRTESLAEAAKAERRRAKYEGVADGLRLAMLDVLNLYWGDRRSIEVHYTTIHNSIRAEWNVKLDELSRERESRSRKGVKPAPYAEWPLKRGA